MSDVTVQNEPENKTDVAPSAPTESAPLPSAETKSGAPASPPPDPSKKQSFSGDVAFNESITIYAGNRLPQYDKGPVKAFAAKGTDKAPSNLIAMICEDHLTPRVMKAGNYGAIINPSVTKLIASGVVDWTPAGKQKYCFVYENTLGMPLMKDDTRGGLGMKPEVALNSIIKPIIGVLQDFRDKDFVHSNIRPSNIFDGGSKRSERVVLGECLSLPASYNQPALYEPIDRAMCSPIGRGPGTQSDDLYAFGVSLAMIMRHNDPNEGLTDDEIIERKMEEGSYITFLGKDRFSGAILELLRGLLYDDENQRWNMDDILVWMDGRRLSPKQAARRSKANRPLHFNDEKYIRPELLSRDLNKNVDDVKQIVESGDLEQWLYRALEDKVAQARYEKALKLTAESGSGAGYADRLATRMGIALYPEGPIRYKSINIFPEGVGPALTEAYIMKRDVQSYHEYFLNYFITQWVDAQSKTVADASNLVGKYDSARAYLRQKNIGGGVEKCIYSMNPEVHCLSEKLAKFHVRTPEEMMYAFEKISASPVRPALFFDRHSIAFLSVKDRKNIDPYTHDMSLPEPHKRAMAEAKALATIQKRSQMEKFPGIAGWMLENLAPVYDRFHDRELRKDIKNKAEKLKESGDLAKIIILFDSPQVYQEDNMNFRKAMRSYYDLEREAYELEKGLRNEKTFGMEASRQITAVVAGILAGIIILVTFFGTMGGHAAPF